MSKYLYAECTILSFRNTDSIWQDSWLLLMVLWKRALTTTVSAKWEHSVLQTLTCGVCLHVIQKQFLHQPDRISFQALVDKQTCQPTLEFFSPFVCFSGWAEEYHKTCGYQNLYKTSVLLIVCLSELYFSYLRKIVSVVSFCGLSWEKI